MDETRAPGINPAQERERRAVTQAMIQITDAVREHSRSAGIGLMLAEAVAEPDDEGLLDQEAERDQRLAAANETGKKVGLYIDESEVRTPEVFTSQAGVKIKSFHLVIENPALFLKALRSLRVEAGSVDQLTPERFEMLVQALQDQLIDNYTSAVQGELEPGAFLAFLDSVEAIRGRLSELVSSRQLAEIERMLEVAKLQCLGEYLKFKTTQCFDLPGEKTFGPSQWHIDATLDFYRKRWDSCLAAVSAATLNPKAHTLTLKAIENLLNCIQFVQDDVVKLLAKPDLTDHLKTFLPQITPILKLNQTALRSFQDVLEKSSPVQAQ